MIALIVAVYFALGVALAPVIVVTSPLADRWWWEARREEIDAIAGERAGRSWWYGASAFYAGIALGAVACVVGWPYVLILRARDEGGES